MRSSEFIVPRQLHLWPRHRRLHLHGFRQSLLANRGVHGRSRHRSRRELLLDSGATAISPRRHRRGMRCQNRSLDIVGAVLERPSRRGDSASISTAQATRTRSLKSDSCSLRTLVAVAATTPRQAVLGGCPFACKPPWRATSSPRRSPSAALRDSWRKSPIHRHRPQLAPMRRSLLRASAPAQARRASVAIQRR